MKSFKKRSSSGIRSDSGNAAADQTGTPQNASSSGRGTASALSPRSCTSPTSNDQFSARRSARVSTKKFAEGDNDTWHENLAVIENPQQQANARGSGGGNDGNNNSNNTANNNAADASVPQLALRSYFQSKSTGQRVWDEPPSGASNVVYASEEVRRMALIQMEDLQVSTEVVRAASAHANDAEDGFDGDGGGGDNNGGNGAADASGKSAKPKVLGRFKIGRKSSNNDEDKTKKGSGGQGSSRHRKIRYKPGRAPYGATAAYSESIDEAQLERAKMLSLQEMTGGNDGSGGNNSNHEEDAALAAAMMDATSPHHNLQPTRSEEEEEAAIAMAMAISLSEAEAKKAELSPVAASIDDMRRETAAAATSSPSSRPDPPENGYYDGDAGVSSSSSARNGSSSLRYRGKSAADDRKPSASGLC